MHSRCSWINFKLIEDKRDGQGLIACAGLDTPSPGGKHRQGEGLRGPVQRRRECGTLYDIDWFFYMS
jgi:hypothetical protein